MDRGERGDRGPRRDEGVLAPPDFRDDDARGVERVLLSLSSRLSCALVLMRGDGTGALSLFPALRDRCFIFDGLITFSRVIGDDETDIAAAAGSGGPLILFGRILLLVSPNVKSFDELVGGATDGPEDIPLPVMSRAEGKVGCSRSTDFATAPS